MRLEPAELVDIIQQLYQLNSDNKVFLTSRLLTELDVEALAAPYRKTIQQVFNPPRGFPSLKLRAGRKALTDFKRACSDPKAVADLLIFYVEQGVICTNNYGDINESFYSSLESVYAEAIKVISAVGADLVEELRPRMRGIVRKTSGMGWGFHDALSDMYHNDYPPEE
jgi:hypothetical protein